MPNYTGAAGNTPHACTVEAVRCAPNCESDQEGPANREAKDFHGPDCPCKLCNPISPYTAMHGENLPFHKPGCKCGMCPRLQNRENLNVHGPGCFCAMCERLNQGKVNRAAIGSHGPGCRCKLCNVSWRNNPNNKDGETYQVDQAYHQGHVPNCRCAICKPPNIPNIPKIPIASNLGTSTDPRAENLPPHGPRCQCHICIITYSRGGA